MCLITGQTIHGTALKAAEAIGGTLRSLHNHIEDRLVWKFCRTRLGLDLDMIPGNMNEIDVGLSERPIHPGINMFLWYCLHVKSFSRLILIIVVENIDHLCVRFVRAWKKMRYT